MIVGIGTDIVQRRRIAEVYSRFGIRFANRVLAADERERFAACANPVAFLAKRFAAKEAVAKALGVGIGARANLHDIIVEKSPQGAPLLRLEGRASETARQRRVAHAHLSISDEQDYALAFVLLESA